MKRYAWMLAAPVAMALAMPCAAQTQSSSSKLGFATNDDIIPAGHFRRYQQLPCPCPPVTPTDPTKPPPEVTPTPTPTPTSDVPNFGGYKSSFGQGTPVSAGSGIGGAVASAAAGLPIPQANARTATITTNSTPLILPGLFTSTTTQSAIPLDRVFFDYGHFNRY